MYSGSKKAKSILVLASILVTSSASTLLSIAAGPSETYQETMTLGCSQEYDADIEQKKIDDERSIINEEQRQLYVELSSLIEKQKQLSYQDALVLACKIKKKKSPNKYSSEEELKIVKKKIAREQREWDELRATQKAKQAKVSIQLLAIDLEQMKLNLNKSLPILSKTQWENEINGIYSPDTIMSIMPLLSELDVKMVDAKKDMELSIKHLTDLYIHNIKFASTIEESGSSQEYYKNNALRILSTIREIHNQYYLQALEIGVTVSNLQKDIFEIILGSDKNRSLENEVQKLMDIAKEKRHISRENSKNKASAEMSSIDSEN